MTVRISSVGKPNDGGHRPTYTDCNGKPNTTEAALDSSNGGSHTTETKNKNEFEKPEDPVEWIDNSQKVYVPVRLSCGVSVLCRPEVLVKCPMILQDLNSDIKECLRLLPKNLHALVRRTKVWVNVSYLYGPRNNPQVPNHTTTHHHESWLLWARDRPDKTYGIEIYSCFDYRRMRLHWNGPGLFLHEMCHLIHQFALVNGLANDAVQKGYGLARVSGLYDTVRRRDWAGNARDFDLAYAMVDCKEWFAEMSVTYWSQGYRHLDKKDKNQVLLSSPPFMEPSVVDRIQKIAPSDTSTAVNGPPPKDGGFFKRILHHLLPIQAEHSSKLGHCNKFYPYTRGQLEYHDPATFRTLEALWEEIAAWKDPWASSQTEAFCSRAPGCWWPFGDTRRPMRGSQFYLDTVQL